MRKGLLAVVAFWGLIAMIFLKPVWVLIGLFVVFIAVISAAIYNSGDL